MLMFWLAMVLFIGALQYLMPELTRRDLFFAVTVTTEFRRTPQARAILASYRRGIVIVTTTALMLAIYAANRAMDLDAAGVLMLQLLAGTGCFIRAHHQMMPHAVAASPTREASLEPQSRIAGLGALLAGPYILIACAALMTRAHWSEVPDPMPVHWDFYGNPNGWMPKTLHTFGMLTGVETLLCAILTFSVIAKVYFSRRISASGAGAREERRFGWVGIAALVAGSYLSAALAFLPLSPRATLALGGVTSLMVIMIVLSLELIRRGQGGARLASASGGEVIADRTPDRNWIWGIFYYNPDDPALMVEKRFGIGWTLNFAHRGAWLFIGLMVATLAVSLGFPLLIR